MFFVQAEWLFIGIESPAGQRRVQCKALFHLKFLEEPLTKESINSEFKVRVTQIDSQKQRISLEPSEMPESAPEGKTDWKRYKKQKNKKESYDPDNPFLSL